LRGFEKCSNHRDTRAQSKVLSACQVAHLSSLRGSTLWRSPPPPPFFFLPTLPIIVLPWLILFCVVEPREVPSVAALPFATTQTCCDPCFRFPPALSCSCYSAGFLATRSGSHVEIYTMSPPALSRHAFLMTAPCLLHNRGRGDIAGGERYGSTSYCMLKVIPTKELSWYRVGAVGD
jgi:hypothetical protein